ncbi:MAG TPA: lycopene cyclase domain-containing protein, partial [Spirochaetia bacterium]|nr:lycopene cyclase domain-containing protein [Spirochaetia bacterium]
RSEFWVWWLVCFVAFVVVNGLYTALPTIFYNPRALWGIRIGTIPLEDFFYNLGYLGLTLCFYLTFDGWFTTVG